MMTAIYDKPFTEFRTQKAKGCAGLIQGLEGTRMGLTMESLSETKIWPHDPIGRIPATGLFVRPCPVIPRHGFVESRIVNDLKSFQKLVTDVQGEDPEAEIMVSRYIDGDYCVVLTPNSITIGEGNDGATSGLIATHFPFPISLPNWSMLQQLGNSGRSAKEFSPDLMGITDSIFVELVHRRATNDLEIVQLRNGKCPPASHESIPRQTVVEFIMSPGGRSLLEWEAMMKTAPSGTVVCSNGVPISSHYGQHALQNGIPWLMTSPLNPYSKVKPGAILEPLDDSCRPLTELSVQRLGDVLSSQLREENNPIVELLIPGGSYAQRQQNTIDMCTAAAGLSLVTAHNALWWLNNYKTHRIFAAALLMYIRLSVATLVGELRYWRGNGPGRSSQYKWDEANKKAGRYVKLTKVPRKPKVTEGKFQSSSREQVYTRMIYATVPQCLKIALTAHKDFGGGGWGGSIGGPRWADCALSVVAIGTTMDAFIAVPTVENFNTMFNTWHHSINSCHNGDTGMLSKFMASSYVLDAAEDPIKVLLGTRAPRLMAHILQS